jgi:hypothetical protein
MRNTSIFPFIVLLGGFVLLLTKISLLQFSGGVLVMVALFAPFYQDSLRNLFHSDETETKNSEDTEQKASDKRPPLSVSVTMVSPEEIKRESEGVASGHKRAEIATSSAISDLLHSISKLSMSSGGQKIDRLEPTSIKVEFSGNAISDTEISKSKQMLESTFPNIPFIYSQEPFRISSVRSGNVKETFKIHLEALIK